jgi:hypothetical protein
VLHLVTGSSAPHEQVGLGRFVAGLPKQATASGTVSIGLKAGPVAGLCFKNCFQIYF